MWKQERYGSEERSWCVALLARLRPVKGHCHVQRKHFLMG